MIKSFLNLTYRYFFPIKIYLNYLCDCNTSFHISHNDTCLTDICCIESSCLVNSYISSEPSYYLYKKILILNPFETTIFNISNFKLYNFSYSYNIDKIILNNTIIDYNTNYQIYQDMTNKMYYLYITHSNQSVKSNQTDQFNHILPYDIVIKISDKYQNLL